MERDSGLSLLEAEEGTCTTDNLMAEGKDAAKILE